MSIDLGSLNEDRMETIKELVNLDHGGSPLVMGVEGEGITAGREGVYIAWRLEVQSNHLMCKARYCVKWECS